MMQINLKLFLRLLRQYTTLYEETGYYPSEVMVKNSEFVFKGDWIIPTGTHVKFTEGEQKIIPDYIGNSKLAAMSVDYENIQRFVGYASLDIIPGTKVLSMIFSNIFQR